MLKSPKTNTLADGLIQRTSSILDKIASKTVHKVIDRGGRSKTLNEVKPAKNISKKPQNFLEISLVQKEDLLSRKLQDRGYE